MMSAAVKRSRKEASPSCGLSSLPDEMSINCFARVSRSDHAALAMTSKSNRSLVASPELYETRSRMGCTEECVYVFLDTPQDPSPRWFILRRGKGKPFVNRLIPIPSFPTPSAASFVALGCGIYVIGGWIGASKTTLVSFLDCRTHTWSYVPSMRVARAKANAGVLDGKIYVMGGCEDEEAEVFDPKMQTWSSVLIPDLVMSMKDVSKVDGWDSQRKEGMSNDLINTRERLLCCCDPSGIIMWCDPWSGVRQGTMYWRKVYGLEDLRKFLNWNSRFICFVGEMADVRHRYMLKHGYKTGLLGLLPGFKLSNSGGNILIFWDQLIGDDPKRLEVWCAEISLERREEGQIWGTVQWSQPVFTVDPPLNAFTVLHSVSINV